MKRFVKVCVGSTALALGVVFVPAVAGAAQAATSPPKFGGVSAPRVVNLRAVTREKATPHPHVTPPPGYYDPSTIASNRAAAAASGGRRSGLTTLTASHNAVEAGTTSSDPAWEDFPTMSLFEQEALFGPDQAFQPPDTQLAAGPGALLESLNDSLSVWSKTGSLLGEADLNQFFGVPADQSFTDPRVLYDTQAGVFILSGWSLDSTETDTETYLAVSQTSNPFGNWNIYTIASSTTGVLTDQPMTGVCNDKVVVAWNVFTDSGDTYAGAEALVLQKSVLTSDGNLTAADESTITSTSEYRFVPAQSLSSTTTCWMAVNNADNANLGGGQTTPSLGVYAITGTPEADDVSYTETEVPIVATSPPPEPTQPFSTTNDQAIDDGLLTAVWDNGVLWTSATDACTPAGDTTTRDCMRIDEVNAPETGTPSLVLDTDLSQDGVDDYYPAVGLDSDGNLYVSYSASSSSMDPSAYVVASPSTSLGTFGTPVPIAAGQSYYNGSQDGETARWGDYSDVAADPSAPGTVWATGEYAPADGDQGDWGTATAQVSFTAPQQPDVVLAVEGAGEVPYAQAPQLGAGWHSLGGKVVAPPAVAAPPNPYGGTSPAAPLFIATGTTKLLYIRSLTQGWAQLGPVGGSCLGSPAAVITTNSSGVSTLTVACRGTNNALYYNQATVPASGLPQFTTGWKSLGGVLTAGPAVAPIDGALTFFATGAGGHVYTRTLTTGFAGTAWTCLGSPAAAAEEASNDTIFACEGTNRALYESPNGGIGWNGTFSLGGVLSGAPAIAATSLVPYFLVEGDNGEVYERPLTTNFVPLGGAVTGGVGAAALN